ncbi:MAG: hypothetical protein DRJ69_05870, partial [Thermoprotei archaeon]
DGELLAIEVKSSNKPYIALSETRVKRLLDFCKRFVIRCPCCGAEIRPKPILAARFLRREWRFIEIPMDWSGQILLRMSSASRGELRSSRRPGGGGGSSRGMRGR